MRVLLAGFLVLAAVLAVFALQGPRPRAARGAAPSFDDPLPPAPVAPAAPAAAEPEPPTEAPVARAAIEGRVTALGRPLAGVAVEAVAASGRWTAVTDEDGRFRIAAPPGAYGVAPFRVPRMHAALLDPFRDPRRAVTSPAAGVDFDVPFATLDVRVLVDGAAAAGVAVEVTGFDEWSDETDTVRTGAKGGLRVRVRAERAHRLRIAAPGIAPESVELPLLAAGTVRPVVLAAAAVSPARIVVAFAAGAARLPARLVVALTPLDADGAPVVVDTERFEVAPDGPVVIDAPSPGCWTVAAGPVDGDASWRFLPCEESVELAAGRRVPVTLRLVLGGVLHIDAPAAECAIVRADGTPVAVGFLRGGAYATGRLPPGDGPVRVHPVLPAGRYRVTLGAAVRACELVAGRATTVAFDQ